MRSIDAQARVLTRSIEDIRQFVLDADDLSVHVCYLMYLCIRGKIEAVIAFLNEFDPNEASDIVNATCPRFHRGTSLHVALFWNSGEIAQQFFQILRDYGAEYYYDINGHLPWDQVREYRWVDPISNQILGTRDSGEFTDGYHKLREQYGLDIYQKRYHLYMDKETLEAMG